MLSAVDMVVQRRDGPRRLRDDDDNDDDDDIGPECQHSAWLQDRLSDNGRSDSATKWRQHCRRSLVGAARELQSQLHQSVPTF